MNEDIEVQLRVALVVRTNACLVVKALRILQLWHELDLLLRDVDIDEALLAALVRENLNDFTAKEAKTGLLQSFTPFAQGIIERGCHCFSSSARP